MSTDTTRPPDLARLSDAEERTEAIAIGRAITTVVALWLIAAGLVVCLTTEQLNGARLIGGPALAFAGLALLVRLIRVGGARCEL